MPSHLHSFRPAGRLIWSGYSIDHRSEYNWESSELPIANCQIDMGYGMQIGYKFVLFHQHPHGICVTFVYCVMLQ
jgi:hypothetical protein